jgi:hypothetical protein
MSTVVNNKSVSAETMMNQTGNMPKALEDSRTPDERILDKLSESIETGHRHPYLLEHEVDNFDLSLDKDGHLLGVGVDLRASFVGDSYRPRPRTLLTISPEGKSRLEPGITFFGSALMVGHQAFRKLAKSSLNPHASILVYVAEDYPTGAFLHMRTGQPAAVAFKTANVKNVVSFFRTRFPQSLIIACLNSAESKISSRDKAVKAVLRLGGLVAYPNFSKREKNQGLISFNDLGLVHGPEAALERLHHGLQGGNQ